MGDVETRPRGSQSAPKDGLLPNLPRWKLAPTPLQTRENVQLTFSLFAPMHGKRMVAVRSAILMVRGAGVASAATPPKSLGRDGIFGILCRFGVRVRCHHWVLSPNTLLEVG